MSTFHLLRPWWMAALPFGLFMLWLLWRRLATSHSWRAVCDEHLLPHLLVGPRGTRGLLPLMLLGAGLTLAVVALSGPTWETLDRPVYRSKTARVVVLDLSHSMDAGDARPSRLARARFKVADVLRQSSDGQTGLVVFAGDAFVVSPLTDDAKTLLALLPALTTDVMPTQGSRSDLALEQALRLLQQGGAQSGDVLLVTDGVNDTRTTIAAAKLRLSGFPVSVLSVGSERGAPIPLPEGGFLKDRQGNIVVPKTGHARLAEIAAAGGGRFARLSADGRDLQVLLHTGLETPLNTATEETDRSALDWRDEGPWLVLFLLPVAAMAFRRGWLLGLAVLTVGSLSEPVQAFEWQDLWERSDQQAARAIRDGDPAAALGAEDPRWRGSALYRTGVFDRAAKAFSLSDDATGHFNRGNALAREGKLAQALAAYGQALHLKPEHADAEFNRALVDELLKQQQTTERRDSSGGPRSEDPQNSAGDGSQSSNASNQGDSERREEESQASNKTGSAAQDSESSPSISNQARDGTSPDQSGNSTAPQSGSEDLRNQQEKAISEAKKRQADASQGDVPVSGGQLSTEEQQALEQWLRQIPDDPGGLLRRKFALEAQRRRNTISEQQQW